MTGDGKLEPLRLGPLEAHLAGPGLYAVRDTSTERILGDIRVGDDHRFESTRSSGSFAGIHATLAEAMQSLGED